MIIRSASLRQRLGTLEQKFRRISNAQSLEMIRRTETVINGEKYMEDIILKRFEREKTRAVGGEKWKNLAPSTLKHKHSPFILFENGSLKLAAYASVMGTFKFSGRIIWKAPKSPVYAEIHQTGGVIKQKGRIIKIPARPYILSPNAAELRPAYRRARQILGAEFRRRKM